MLRFGQRRAVAPRRPQGLAPDEREHGAGTTEDARKVRRLREPDESGPVRVAGAEHDEADRRVGVEDLAGPRQASLAERIVGSHREQVRRPGRIKSRRPRAGQASALVAQNFKSGRAVAVEHLGRNRVRRPRVDDHDFVPVAHLPARALDGRGELHSLISASDDHGKPGLFRPSGRPKAAHRLPERARSLPVRGLEHAPESCFEEADSERLIAVGDGGDLPSVGLHLGGPLLDHLERAQEVPPVRIAMLVDEVLHERGVVRGRRAVSAHGTGANPVSKEILRHDSSAKAPGDHPDRQVPVFVTRRGHSRVVAAGSEDRVLAHEGGAAHGVLREQVREVARRRAPEEARVAERGQPAGGERRRRVRFQDRDRAFQEGRLEEVVGVEARDVTASRLPNPEVSRARESLIRRPEDPRPRANVRREQVSRHGVRRAVVDQDDLEVAVGLIEDTLDRFIDVRAQVVARDDDRDRRRRICLPISRAAADLHGRVLSA